MNSKSFSVKSIPALNQQLDQFKADNFFPTVAIVFSSVKHNLNELVAVFDLHNIDLIGCSSAGEIHEGEVVENGIVVLAMEMPKSAYQIKAIETGDSTTYQIAHEMGQFSNNFFTNPAVFVFSGGMAVDAEQIIMGMKDGIGREVPLYGGAAADDLTMTETMAFINKKVTNNGLACMVIDTDKISVTGMATSGWEPIGVINKITKSEGNVVYTINDKPALDVFLKYFGFFGVEEGVGPQLETISGQYPFQILREAGYSILRSPLIANEENRSLILAGGVKEGDQFRFSVSPGFEVVEKTIEEFGYLKNNTADADAMILISCKGRHTALGPIIEEEITGIHNYWKAPMVGFFSYGEIGNMKNGTCEFHNETCVMVILKEK